MYKNDIGVSWEVCKFNKLSEWVLQPYVSEKGLLWIVDDYHLVLRTRIHEAILEAVVAERKACKEIVSKYIDNTCDGGNIYLEAIELEIESRNITEAKKQDMKHASEDEKV